MLLRIWMVLLLAAYPALVGWRSPTQCDPADVGGACGACVAPGEVAGCCARPVAPAVRSCCAEPEATATVRVCCTIATRGVCLVLACDDDEMCRIIRACRGPCRTAPAAPLAPPTRHDGGGQADKGSGPGIPSYPLMVAAAPPPVRVADWPIPCVVSGSERLALYCIRTI